MSAVKAALRTGAGFFLLVVPALLPALLAHENENCYDPPPVTGDCVSIRVEGEIPSWVFCHEHFQKLEGMDCNYDAFARQCTARACEPVGNGIWARTILFQPAFEDCRRRLVPSPGCWHCSAYIVCAIHGLYLDPNCADLPFDLTWSIEWDGCF